jgi:hypothetical protein
VLILFTNENFQNSTWYELESNLVMEKANSLAMGMEVIPLKSTYIQMAKNIEDSLVNIGHS